MNELITVLGIFLSPVITLTLAFFGYIRKRDEKVDVRFEQLDIKLEKRFDKIDEKFAKIDEKFDKKFDESIKRTESAENKHDHRFDRLDAKIDSTNQMLFEHMRDHANS